MADALAEDADAMQSPSQIANTCMQPSIMHPGNSGQDDCHGRDAQDSCACNWTLLCVLV